MTIYIIAYIVIGVISAIVARLADIDSEACIFIMLLGPIAIVIGVFFLLETLFDCIPPIKEWRKK